MNAYRYLNKLIVILGLMTLNLSACSYIELSDNGVKISSKLTQVERFLDDVQFISKMPRTPETTHHKNVQKMCADRFRQLGFQVEYHHYGTGTNIIGIYPGKQKPAEQIMISAHYDTVPNCNGADDNASGVAGVFETARLLVSKEHKRTLLVACWDEEERKVLGSKAYVRREKNKATNIKMSYVYEMIGYKENHKNSQQIPIGFERLYPQQVKQISDNKNRGDFIALIYDDLASSLLPMISLHAEKQGLPILQFKVGSQLKRLPVAADLRRSDHSAFWDEDYPAMMITDTANFRNQHYHCINAEDNVQSLDATFAIKTINTISKTIEDNLNR